MEYEGLMKAKLKKLEDIKRNRKVTYRGNDTVVWYSEANRSINIHGNRKINFGRIIEVKLWADFLDRKIYYDGVSKDESGQLYYDEWFEFIYKDGYFVKEICDIGDLWNIKDL